MSFLRQLSNRRVAVITSAITAGAGYGLYTSLYTPKAVALAERKAAPAPVAAAAPAAEVPVASAASTESASAIDLLSAGAKKLPKEIAGAVIPVFSNSAATEIGSFGAGGIMFKDKVKVVAINDPAVSGVTCHVSYVERALNPFSDPSGSSCSCIRTADTIRFNRPINTSAKGEAVFSQQKNWLFKSLKVRRIYDPTTNSLVYVSYSDRLITNNEQRGDRFKTSVSNVRLKRNEQLVGHPNVSSGDDD